MSRFLVWVVILSGKISFNLREMKAVAILAILFFSEIVFSSEESFKYENGSESFAVDVVSGSDLLSEEKKEFLITNHKIQLDKISELLGLEIDASVIFEEKIFTRDEFNPIKPYENSTAFTEDGIIHFSVDAISQENIRHETLHALVYGLVGDKMPWDMEEGLAQILSGELASFSDKSRDSTANIVERRYDLARLKVSKLVERCGFRSFGKYLDLLKTGNTERYSYNRVFNEECGSE